MAKNRSRSDYSKTYSKPAMIMRDDGAISAAISAYPQDVSARLTELRSLILETANGLDGVGPLTETLKWGQPAYLTEHSRSGTTIRIGAPKSRPGKYCLYVHCGTDLVSRYRTLFDKQLSFEGDRAIVLDVANDMPKEILSICIEMALTYHLARRAS